MRSTKQFTYVLAKQIRKINCFSLKRFGRMLHLMNVIPNDALQSGEMHWAWEIIEAIKDANESIKYEFVHRNNSVTRFHRVERFVWMPHFNTMMDCYECCSMQRIEEVFMHLWKRNTFGKCRNLSERNRWMCVCLWVELAWMVIERESFRNDDRFCESNPAAQMMTLKLVLSWRTWARCYLKANSIPNYIYNELFQLSVCKRTMWCDHRPSSCTTVESNDKIHNS